MTHELLTATDADYAHAYFKLYGRYPRWVPTTPVSYYTPRQWCRFYRSEWR